MAKLPRVRPHHAPLVAFEHLCIGAWLATIVVTWTIVFADFGQRWKAEGAEVVFGVGLVFFALRRRAQGLDVLLPFALLTLAFCGFLYVAPPMLGVVKAGSAEKQVLATTVAAALDAAETIGLLTHFVRTWRR